MFQRRFTSMMVVAMCCDIQNQRIDAIQRVQTRRLAAEALLDPDTISSPPKYVEVAYREMRS